VESNRRIRTALRDSGSLPSLPPVGATLSAGGTGVGRNSIDCAAAHCGCTGVSSGCAPWWTQPLSSQLRAELCVSTSLLRTRSRRSRPSRSLSLSGSVGLAMRLARFAVPSPIWLSCAVELPPHRSRALPPR
jgi:hypothetical protein